MQALKYSAAREELEQGEPHNGTLDAWSHELRL